MMVAWVMDTARFTKITYINVMGYDNLTTYQYHF